MKSGAVAASGRMLWREEEPKESDAPIPFLPDFNPQSPLISDLLMISAPKSRTRLAACRGKGQHPFAPPQGCHLAHCIAQPRLPVPRIAPFRSDLSTGEVGGEKRAAFSAPLCLTIASTLRARLSLWHPPSASACIPGIANKSVAWRKGQNGVPDMTSQHDVTNRK